LAYFSGDGWLAALAEPLKETEARLIMTPDSTHSRIWLPRLAARWQVPLVSRCSQVRVKADGEVEITRPVYNGLQQETFLAPAVTPLLVTLLPGLRGVSAPDPTRQAEVISLTPNLDPTTWRDHTHHRLLPDPNTVDISEAERIVSGGLGIGGPEGVELLAQLAQALQATVGGTRVISDRGWIPHERYIGSTGKTVAPKLYLALGISGASQHTVGMSSSETIIAVNSDRTAPIFGLADLGIIGDLHEIVPRLVAKLEKESAKHEA
jgi:electron transfer flavoprotein alpha subunit